MASPLLTVTRSHRLFHPAWWIRGRHAQTLWGRFFRAVTPPELRHERWDTPDGDVVDAYRLSGPRDRPHLLLLHGLEGGLRSHYARGMLAEAARRQWSATLLVFRSCGPELNRLARFYHSGDTGDARLALQRLLAEGGDGPILLAGVSLGGNVLLRLLAEEGKSAAPRIAGAAVLSVPYDLASGSRYIQRGFSRVYEQHFVRSLRRKALAKVARFQDFPSAEEIRATRTLYDFDDRVTAPLHGFAGAEDYYARCSSLPVLGHIRVPTLLVSALDDPFLPFAVLERVLDAAEHNPFLEALFVPRGGHVGFVSGSPWRQIYWGEARLFEFLEERALAWKQQRESQAITGGAA